MYIVRIVNNLQLKSPPAVNVGDQCLVLVMLMFQRGSWQPLGYDALDHLGHAAPEIPFENQTLNVARLEITALLVPLNCI